MVTKSISLKRLKPSRVTERATEVIVNPQSGNNTWGKGGQGQLVGTEMSVSKGSKTCSWLPQAASD